MIVYLVLMAAILLIYELTGKNATRKNQRDFLIISALIIILVVGSRHRSYGFSDEGMYYLQYLRAQAMSLPDWIIEFEEVRDYGYGVMVWFLSRIIPWAQFLLYFHCAVFISACFIFLYKHTQNSLAAVLLLFGGGLFSFYMTAIRQSFGFSLCIFAYLAFESALEKRAYRIPKILLSVLLFAIATTMHKSVYIMALIFVVLLIRNGSLKIVFAIFASLAVFLFRDDILEYGNDFVDRNYTTVTASSFVGFVINLIIAVLPFVFMFLYALNRSNKMKLLTDDSILSMSTLSLVGIAFYIIRLYALVFERIAFLFSFFAIPLYEPTVEYCFDSKTKKHLYFLLNVLAVGLFLYRVATSRIGMTYIFFWQ